MARITLSGIISDIRGRIGTNIFSIWKGIHIVKSTPTNFRYAWKSTESAQYRTLIALTSNYWRNVLSPAEKATWATYAEYLEALGAPYYGPTVFKLLGWKQYGGTMSAFNAFALTNALRLSIGKTVIALEAPPTGDSLPTPDFGILEYIPGSPNVLRATIARPAALYQDAWLRVWCRGTQSAHLIIAKVVVGQIGDEPTWTVNYECSVEPDVAVPAWILGGVDFCTVVNGVIEIDTITPGGAALCSYKRNEAAFDNAVGWTVEVDMKVLTSAAEDERIRLRIEDGAWEDSLVFSSSKIKLIDDGTEYAMDTTDDYHVYRVTGKGTVIKVYVDDVLVITGTLVNADLDKSVTFGDGSAVAGQNSKSRWNYVKYFLGGDKAPQAERIEWENMRYAEGGELPLVLDSYQAQMDYIGADGRFSPPSAIKTVDVRETFPGGLWDESIWSGRIWG